MGSVDADEKQLYNKWIWEICLQKKPQSIVPARFQICDGEGICLNIRWLVLMGMKYPDLGSLGCGSCNLLCGTVFLIRQAREI